MRQCYDQGDGSNRLALPTPVAAFLVVTALSCFCSGCGGSGAGVSPLVQRAIARRDSSSNYQTLYNFGSYSGDGAFPFAGLLTVSGTLYGTTDEGGTNGAGTVFSIAPSGAETVLHSFAGGPDGKAPTAELVAVGDVLYGTTTGGGSSGGTVFSVTPSGTETVLHGFAGGSGDGMFPYAGLTVLKGQLYGTTYGGGASGDGTVFRITTAGTETVLHSFKGGPGDGTGPLAGLAVLKGRLYGTTYGGGANGNGTIFRITARGAETVLYSFKGGSNDGVAPEARLTVLKDALYGTTYAGGVNNVGTVFRVTTSGKENVLHSFAGFDGGLGDGANPYAALVAVSGILYGTTTGGGAHDDGTIFSVTPKGAETMLYSFAGGLGDGSEPRGALSLYDGTLYGTTEGNGSNDSGTVFTLATP